VTRCEDRLVFLDLETTGLDVRRDSILEVGVIVTDADLNESDRWHWLVISGRHREKLERRDRESGGSVHAMHETSGLLADLDRGVGIGSLHEVERELCERLGDLGAPPGSLQLAGYSVHFDRRFLDAHMPLAGRYLSHRIVDVSTIRSLYRRWVGEPPPQGKAHRALADCEEAIAELKFYRTDIMKVGI